MASLAKLPRYLKGVTLGLLRGRPRRWRKLLGRSPYTVYLAEQYGFSIVLSIDDSAISRPLLCTGVYEPHVTHALLSRLKPDTRFLDIGANIGFYTLLVAARSPEGRIYSFEPDRANRQLLEASLALNGFGDHVSVFPFAVSDRDEMLSFSNLENPDNLGARFTARNPATLAAHAPSGHPDIKQVEAVRLDRLLADEKIDLIKIDIEGFEPQAFEGMAGLIERCHPTIISEFAPGTIQHISGSDPQELLKFFDRHGYDVSIIETDGSLSSTEEPADVMARFADPHTHHVDLLLKTQEFATSD